MNKQNISIWIIILFFPVIVSAQGWEKTYDGGFNDGVSAANLAQDGGVVMAGTISEDTSNIEHSYLYKTDVDGVLQWEYHDTAHATNFVNTLEMLSASDGNYLLSFLYGATLPMDNAVVQKITPNGDLLWEYSMPTNFLDYVTDIAESADGGYLLKGIRTTNTMSGRVVGVVKLDNNGIVEWEKEFEDPNLPSFSGDIIEAANTDVIIVGYMGYANDSQDAFVKRLDSNGNIIWENLYDNAVNDFDLEVIELDNGDLVVNGTSTTGINGIWTTTLQKLDSEGNEIWYKSYDGNQQIRSFTKTADGGFALAGYTEDYSPGWQDFFLLKVDSTGTEEWIKNYGRSRNDYLAEVMIAPDMGFFLAGSTQRLDNNVDAYLIKTDSLGFSLTNELNGNVFDDNNFDCVFDNNEPGLEQWFIEAQKGAIHYMTVSDTSGNYSFELDTGTYDIFIYPISPYWEVCDTNFSVSFAGFYETVTEDIPAQAIIDCPLLDVSIGTQFLRRCFENTYYVNYCNYGTTTAEDAYIEILLDSAMIYNDASIPLESQDGFLFTFNLGDIPVGECGNFSIDFMLGDTLTNCDSVLIGQTHCVEAHIYPDSLCLPIENWSGASIEVDATCNGDSITFYIQNVGNAPTQPNLQYFVIEDDVILYEGNFTLNPNESKIISVLTNGSTFRLEAQQEPNHPGFSMPSVSVEGCGDENLEFSIGFVNIFAQDDANPFVDIDCRQNVASFDPNDKRGFPIGFGDENYIYRGQEIEYLVRFQNTGTDTAFFVVIRDTLSDHLDITSVRPGAASHPYEFDVSTEGVLNFRFNNIMLPDSNINEAASHGFVKFKVAQQPDLEVGTQIFNSAAIYFDFNAPVITNKTLHTIDEPIFTVSIDPVIHQKASVKVFPNPFVHSATFEIEGTYIEQGYFKLFDINGRLVRLMQFDGDRFEINKNNLQPGMYFFIIENNGQMISSGKIIAQ